MPVGHPPQEPVAANRGYGLGEANDRQPQSSHRKHYFAHGDGCVYLLLRFAAAGCRTATSVAALACDSRVCDALAEQRLVILALGIVGMKLDFDLHDVSFRHLVNLAQRQPPLLQP